MRAICISNQPVVLLKASEPSYLIRLLQIHHFLERTSPREYRRVLSFHRVPCKYRTESGVSRKKNEEFNNSLSIAWLKKGYRASNDWTNMPLSRRILQGEWFSR